MYGKIAFAFRKRIEFHPCKHTPMKNLLPDIELIERYFDNNLSFEETDDLKNRLKNDLAFQKLFDHEKLLINTIRYQAAKKDLDFLKGIEKSFSEKSPSYF